MSLILRYCKSFVLLSTIACAPAICQQSAFQSGNGQTSIYLGRGGKAATFNSGDTKVSVGYLDRHSERWWFWGYEAFAKASSGVTTLFSSKVNIPEGGADFVYGWHQIHNTSETKDQWALMDVGYSRSSFYVSNVPEPPAAAKRYFDRFRAVAAWNRKFSDHFLFGVASGAERRNNLDDLTQVTFQTAVLGPVAGGSTQIVKTKDGFLGNYREYIAAPLYTDMLLILPRKIKVPGFGYRVAVDGFTRSDLAAAHRSADGGIGVFLTQEHAVTRVVGGLAGSWNGGKAKVALVASYNF